MANSRAHAGAAVAIRLFRFCTLAMLLSHQKNFGDHGPVARTSNVRIACPAQAQFTARGGGTWYIELHDPEHRRFLQKRMDLNRIVGYQLHALFTAAAGYVNHFEPVRSRRIEIPVSHGDRALPAGFGETPPC